MMRSFIKVDMERIFPLYKEKELAIDKRNERGEWNHNENCIVMPK